MNETRTLRPQLALEMTMRDVLGNMEEMASDFAYHDMGGEFEILAIEPATVPNTASNSRHGAHMRELFSAELHRLPLSA